MNGVVVGWLIWFGNGFFLFVLFCVVLCCCFLFPLVEKTPSLVVKEEYQNRRMCVANTVDTWKRSSAY